MEIRLVNCYWDKSDNTIKSIDSSLPWLHEGETAGIKMKYSHWIIKSKPNRRSMTNKF